MGKTIRAYVCRKYPEGLRVVPAEILSRTFATTYVRAQGVVRVFAGVASTGNLWERGKTGVFLTYDHAFVERYRHEQLYSGTVCKLYRMAIDTYRKRRHRR
jgi:hypothetical protein